MPVNPRNTLLIKPGDPSDVYQIGKPRFLYDTQLNVDPPMNPPAGMHVPVLGDDVTNWHSVLWTAYTDPDDAHIANSRVFVSVWRYYDSASPAVFSNTNAYGALALYTARGQWVQGEHQWIALNGSASGLANALPEFIVVPTYNCDRIYFQIREYGGTAGTVHWLGHAVYGVTPRTPDGSIPPVLGAVASATSGSADDTKTTVTSGTAGGADPAALLVATAAATTDFELVAVRIKIASAPATANEPILVTLDSALGATYDTVLYRVDPTVLGLTDVVFEPKTRSLFNTGDAIRVSWANTGDIVVTCAIYTRDANSV